MESILQMMLIISCCMSGLAIILVFSKCFKNLIKAMEINEAKISSNDLFDLFLLCLWEIGVSLFPVLNIYEILQCSLYLANMIKEEK